MSDYKHPLGGNISEFRPTVCAPAIGVITIVAEDNSTIDMTPEQAFQVAEELSFYAEVEYRKALKANGR
jgi:hypothetical protein